MIYIYTVYLHNLTYDIRKTIKSISHVARSRRRIRQTTSMHEKEGRKERKRGQGSVDSRQTSLTRL